MAHVAAPGGQDVGLCFHISRLFWLQAAARIVLQDWNTGKIPYYTLPPARETVVEGSSVVVPGYSDEFNADQVTLTRVVHGVVRLPAPLVAQPAYWSHAAAHSPHALPFLAPGFCPGACYGHKRAASARVDASFLNAIIWCTSCCGSRGGHVWTHEHGRTHGHGRGRRGAEIAKTSQVSIGLKFAA